jgi:hypothetical protein
VKQHWILNVQHGVFRLVSFAFSLVSAHAIYWFFSALNGVDSLQPIVTVVISLGFAVLGYFVTRGLAHRLMLRKAIWSYAFIGVLFVFVEVVCNYGESAARYPDIVWLHQLTGVQLAWFTYLVPLVLSIIPVFNIALAYIDTDLMQEKGLVGGMVPSTSMQGMYGKAPTAVPGRGMVPGGGYTPAPKQMAPSYPTMPAGAAPGGRPVPTVMPPLPLKADGAAAQGGGLGSIFNGLSKMTRRFDPEHDVEAVG